MLLLAFDTATPAVTVALYDGRRVVADSVVVDAARHGELLAPAIAKVCADAGVAQTDLTGIAVGVGPGPYTGLRVGLVTARVLAWTLEIPVHGVCTLDVIAFAASREAGGRPYLVATDARRREVYWARYGPSGDRLAGPHVGRAADVPDGASLPVAGEGALLYPQALPNRIDPVYPPPATLAEAVARRLSGAADGPALLPPQPLYLRRPDARVPGPPKRVTAP